MERCSFIAVDLHHLLFAGFDRRTRNQNFWKEAGKRSRSSGGRSIVRRANLPVGAASGASCPPESRAGGKRSRGRPENLDPGAVTAYGSRGEPRAEGQLSTLKRHPWPRRRMVGSTRKRAFGYARRAADLRVSAPARPGAALLHAPIAARPQRMSETGKRLTPACIPDWPAASSSRPA